jgi:hypothetical protein
MYYVTYLLVETYTYSKPLKPLLHFRNITDVRTYHSEFIWVGRAMHLGVATLRNKRRFEPRFTSFYERRDFFLSLDTTLQSAATLRITGGTPARPHLQNVAHRKIKGWILLAPEPFSDTPESCRHLPRTKLCKKYLQEIHLTTVL